MTDEEAKALIKASVKRFYCYTLSRPDGRPFYVGVGRGLRAFSHEKQARTNVQSHKLSVIRLIWSENKTVDYSISFFATQEEATREECRLIALYGRVDIGTGLLTNLTDGGDGFVGVHVTERWRSRMSESAKQRSSQPFIEGARKWRESNMDQVFIERRDRWNNQEYRERHLVAMANPETRSLMSQKMLERLADPEKAQKLKSAISAARGKPVTINSVTYPTLIAAATALGISNPDVISYRIRKGIEGYSWAEKKNS